MKGDHPKGYTILELMIVLAVTATMFTSVVVIFGDRHRQVQFSQGVRDLDGKIQAVIRNVSTGFFNVEGSVNCTVAPTGAPLPVVVPAGTSDELGSNEYCVLIGKVVQFSPEDNNPSTDNGAYLNVYDMVGLRENPIGSNPQTLALSRPTAVPRATKDDVKWGVKVTNVGIVDQSDNVITRDLGAISVFSSTLRENSLISSATNEQTQIDGVAGSALDITESAFIGIANAITDPVNPTNRVVICLTDSFDKRKATITLGGNQVGSTINFDDYNVDLCGAET